MSDKNCIEFNFQQMSELAALIAALNREGVPYSLRKDNFAIEISISKGY
jgi:hypothetical protein